MQRTDSTLVNDCYVTLMGVKEQVKFEQTEEVRIVDGCLIIEQAQNTTCYAPYHWTQYYVIKYRPLPEKLKKFAT